MIWQKKFADDYHKNFDTMLLLTFILIAIGLIFKRPLLFAIVGLFLTYMCMHSLYDRNIGKYLSIHNVKETIRLFPGDASTLRIVFENRSILPYMNGKLRFQLDNAVYANERVVDNKQNMTVYEMPLSIIGRTQTVVEIPIQAKKRGLVRISKITYTFPHLFNFASVELTYTPFYRTEYIVFPALEHMSGMKRQWQIIFGEQVTHISPFEDMLSPIGTRVYHLNDPFHRINWKATAKTGQLQTNVYEKNIDQSYLIIVNLEAIDAFDFSRITQNMEHLLSCATYLSEYLTKNNLPYEIAVNGRILGDVPFFHIPKDHGSIHYAKTLEMLARIPSQPLLLPFPILLNYLKQRILYMRTIVIIGEIPKNVYDILHQWRLYNRQILHVGYEQDRGVIRSWGEGAC